MTYLALLRGINVGGNNRIGMAKLKQTFERLKFTGVKTFIASGNVIFRSNSTDQKKITDQIENAIKQDFGISIRILLRDIKSIEKLVKTLPALWINDKNIKCDVMFLWEEADKPAIFKELPFDPKIEDSKYIPGTILWRIDRDKATKSRIFKRIIGTKLHQQMTIRNPNTVRKLYALMLEAEKEVSLYPQKKISTIS